MPKRITVIGAGPGGYNAAFLAAQKGAEVTLVESTWLGGTCLNCGCIPTKTLKSSCEALETIHRAQEFGLSGTQDIKADMKAIVDRKRRVTSTLVGGLEKTCASLKIQVVKGKGKLINAQKVEALCEDGTNHILEGDKVILASGSSTFILPSLPLYN